VKLIKATVVCLLAQLAATRAPAQGHLPDLIAPDGFGLHLMRWSSAEDLDNTVAAGFKVVRLGMGWSTVEREKGVYDFATPGYDGMVQRCTDRGLRMMLILGSRNRLYGPMRTEEARRGLAAYTKAAAERYHGKNILWDIWNEPNFESFWEVTAEPRYGIRPTPASKQDAADFCKLVEAVSTAIKSADPTGIVLAPGTSEIRVERGYEEELFRNGLLKWIDAFSTHPYQKQPPEGAVADYNALRLLMQKYGREVPIVQGEWGYSLVNWDRTTLSEETKANYLVRMMLTSLYAGVPVSLWHTLYDMKTTNQRENNFGIMSADHQPKLAFTAAKTLNATLAGYRFAARLDFGLFTDYDYALRFTKGAGVAIAFWTMEDKHQSTLPVGPGEGVLVDLTGTRKPIAWQTDGLKVELSQSPQYLVMTANHP
jgi:polysaccharide biosynthesis protein PslG